MSLKPAHDPSCVLAYPFEEASDTTVYDQSQYGRNGTIYGATRVQGKLGKGMYFDGVDDYVQSSAFALTGTAISIVAWVKCDEYDKHQTIVSKEKQSSSQGYIFIYRISNSHGIDFQFATGTGIQALSFWYFFVGYDNQYLFVAFTCDYQNKILNVYRNGQLYESRNVADTMIPPSTSSVCYIGSFLRSGFFFKGVIDEVRLYNRLLSDREILELYRYGISQRARIRLPMFERVKRR